VLQHKEKHEELKKANVEAHKKVMDMYKTLRTLSGKDRQAARLEIRTLRKLDL
jgi:hypothetical protein